MAKNTQDLSLFGLDLRTLGQDFLTAWHALQTSRWLAWLKPPVSIHVYWDAQRHGLYSGSGSLDAVQMDVRGKNRFIAVVLPEDILLHRRFTVPRAAAAELHAAAALDAQNASPFPQTDLVYAHQVVSGNETTLDVELVLASKRAVQAHLKHMQESCAIDTERVEVWGVSSTQVPMVFDGFGEAARESQARARQRINQALLLLIALILGAVAVTPTLQLRARALQAAQKYEALAKEVAPLVQKRESLVKSADVMGDLKTIMTERMGPLEIMAVITQAVPDDTNLLNLQVQGLKVTIAGQTANAAALMQHLGSLEGIRDVKAPSPAVKPPGAAKENFTVEFMLVPPPVTELEFVSKEVDKSLPKVEGGDPPIKDVLQHGTDQPSAASSGGAVENAVKNESALAGSSRAAESGVNRDAGLKTSNPESGGVSSGEMRPEKSSENQKGKP